MSPRGFLLVVALGACVDKAKPDWDRCMERDQNYDVPGAYSACQAAVAADPNGASGQAAAKKLDQLKPVIDRIQVEKDLKAARELAIKKSDPTVLALGVPPAPVKPEWDGGANGPNYVAAQTLADSGDLAGARAMIEARFVTGKAATDEIALLKTICKTQKDKRCLASLAKPKPH
jgi:hypothetical protein